MPKKRLKYLVIHCWASREGQEKSVEDLYKIHFIKNKWKRFGYSELFHLDGTVSKVTNYDEDEYVENHEITWGCAGVNAISRHICYVGGCDKNGKPKDTRTQKQKFALEFYVKDFLKKHPTCKVVGHRQVIAKGGAPKACPSFDVPSWLAEIGVDEKNIEFRKNIFN